MKPQSVEPSLFTKRRFQVRPTESSVTRRKAISIQLENAKKIFAWGAIQLFIGKQNDLQNDQNDDRNDKMIGSKWKLIGIWCNHKKRRSNEKQN